MPDTHDNTFLESATFERKLDAVAVPDPAAGDESYDDAECFCQVAGDNPRCLVHGTGTSTRCPECDSDDPTMAGIYICGPRAGTQCNHAFHAPTPEQGVALPRFHPVLCPGCRHCLPDLQAQGAGEDLCAREECGRERAHHPRIFPGDCPAFLEPVSPTGVELGGQEAPTVHDEEVWLTVCTRSGQLPEDCCLAACENGCNTRDLQFVPMASWQMLWSKLTKAEARLRHQAYLENGWEQSYEAWEQSQRLVEHLRTALQAAEPPAKRCPHNPRLIAGTCDVCVVDAADGGVAMCEGLADDPASLPDSDGQS